MTSIVAQDRAGRDSGVARFLDAVAGLAGMRPADVRTLVSTCDVRLETPGWRSTLNNDGFPLQACVSVDQHGRAVRLLVDPAPTEADPERRLRRGSDVLAGLLRRLPDRLARETFASAVCDALPPAGALAGLRSGALWLGLDPAGRGAAAYVTARWGRDDERWPRVLAWMARWAGPAVPAALAALPPAADPTSVGVEQRGRETTRAKVYFRLRAPRPLAALGIPFFLEPSVSRFLRLALEDFAVRRDGLVCSVSAEFSGSRLTDGKIDVCGHCTPRPASAWTACLGRLSDTLGLTNPGVDEALLAGLMAPAFVGLGVRRDGARRLNVYLEPVTNP